MLTHADEARRDGRLPDIDLVTLHRDETRHAFFEDRRGEPPFFDRAVNAWIVADGAQIAALLRSPHLNVTRCATAGEEIQAATGHSFENIIFAFTHLATCLNDAEHRENHRRIAVFLNERRLAVAGTLPDLVEESFGLFETRARLDLAQDVLDPLAARLLLSVAGIEVEASEFSRVAPIFDRLLGLRKRLRLEDDVGKLNLLIRKSLGPQASPEEVGLRMAVLILGGDSLVGTFGQTLFRLFDTQSGRKLSEMEYPAMPSDTGVPYNERIVIEPFEFSGIAFRLGERLRFMLQSFSYTDNPGDRARLFGAGIHTCLGRPLALDLWAHTTARLSKIDRRVEILRHELRKDNYLFTCPKIFEIQLSP